MTTGARASVVYKHIWRHKVLSWQRWSVKTTPLSPTSEPRQIFPQTLHSRN